MIQLPVLQTKSADFTYTIELDTINTQIRLTWNVRSESWYINIETPNCALNGVKVVENYLLTAQNKALFGELPGDFLALKITDIDNPETDTLTYDNLGSIWAIVYMDETEVNDWRSFNGI